MYGNNHMKMKKRLIDCIENCENEGYAIDSIETDTEGIHDISISVDLIKIGEGRTQQEEFFLKGKGIIGPNEKV